MLLLKIMEEEVKSQGKVKAKSQLVLGTNYYLDKITVEKNINGEGAFWAPPPPILHRVKHLPKVGAEISSSKTVAPKFSIPRKLDLGP